MSFSFLLLGKVNVAFFDASSRKRVPTKVPPQGLAGVGQNFRDFVGRVQNARDKVKRNPNGPDLIVSLDVSVKETHTLESQITEHEVENSLAITDHIRRLPRRLSIEGLITDTPSGLRALAVVPGLQDRFATVPRSIQQFQVMEAAWKASKLLDVVTNLKVYQNMAIESITIPRDTKVGRSLRFSINLREVVVVENKTLSPFLDGASTASLGTQSPKRKNG